MWGAMRAVNSSMTAWRVCGPSGAAPGPPGFPEVQAPQLCVAGGPAHGAGHRLVVQPVQGRAPGGLTDALEGCPGCGRVTDADELGFRVPAGTVPGGRRPSRGMVGPPSRLAWACSSGRDVQVASVEPAEPSSTSRPIASVAPLGDATDPPAVVLPSERVVRNADDVPVQHIALASEQNRIACAGSPARRVARVVARPGPRRVQIRRPPGAAPGSGSSPARGRAGVRSSPCQGRSRRHPGARVGALILPMSAPSAVQ